ncbi:MAG: hypothetical protein QW461_10775 [Candidatus Jordarchaeales archaeon]
MIITVDERGIAIIFTAKERERFAKLLKNNIPALKLVPEKLIIENIPQIFRLSFRELSDSDMRRDKEGSEGASKAGRKT